MSYILLQQQFLYKLGQSAAVIRDGLHGFLKTWKDLPDFCCDLQSSEQAVCLHSECGVKNYYCDLLEVRFVNTQSAGTLDHLHRWVDGPKITVRRKLPELGKFTKKYKTTSRPSLFKPERSSLVSSYKASLKVTLDTPQEMFFILVFCF